MSELIDTRKLRRLIRERHQRFQHARDMTDRFLPVKGQIGELQRTVDHQRRHDPQGANESNVQTLEHLKSELAELSKEREQAGQRAQSMGYVQRLVEHARKLGYEVDEISGSIRAVRPPAKPASTTPTLRSWAGFNPRVTYTPGAPYGR